jgi:hypothetical protein
LSLPVIRLLNSAPAEAACGAIFFVTEASQNGATPAELDSSGPQSQRSGEGNVNEGN